MARYYIAPTSEGQVERAYDKAKKTKDPMDIAEYNRLARLLELSETGRYQSPGIKYMGEVGRTASQREKAFVDLQEEINKIETEKQKNLSEEEEIRRKRITEELAKQREVELALAERERADIVKKQKELDRFRSIELPEEIEKKQGFYGKKSKELAQRVGVQKLLAEEESVKAGRTLTPYEREQKQAQIEAETVGARMKKGQYEAEISLTPQKKYLASKEIENSLGNLDLSTKQRELATERIENTIENLPEEQKLIAQTIATNIIKLLAEEGSAKNLIEANPELGALLKITTKAKTSSEEFLSRSFQDVVGENLVNQTAETLGVSSDKLGAMPLRNVMAISSALTGVIQSTITTAVGVEGAKEVLQPLSSLRAYEITDKTFNNLIDDVNKYPDLEAGKGAGYFRQELIKKVLMQIEKQYPKADPDLYEKLISKRVDMILKRKGLMEPLVGVSTWKTNLRTRKLSQGEIGK